MATYTKVYNNPYPDGWKDGKDGNTPVTASILNNQTETIEAIEQYLEDNPIEQGGSGTGGATDYENLSNKPKINGVELVGDLSSEDLGITGGGGSGTTNYEDLTNKPSINGTELSGDIALDIPEKTSDLTNDSGFLTDIKGKSYNDLADKPQINGIDLQGNLTVEELGLLDITESTNTTLENSKDGILKIKTISGNTEQDTTSGKNLLDCSGLTEQTTNGVTFTPVYAENGTLEYINVNGTATASNHYVIGDITNLDHTTSYKLNGSPNSGRLGVYNTATAGTRFDTGSGLTFIRQENEDKITIYVSPNDGAYNNVKFYPMIRLASITDDTYEPFTDGASPNPKFPQPLRKVVLSEIKTCRKNMTNIAEWTTGGIETDGTETSDSRFGKDIFRKVKPNTTYTLSCNTALTLRIVEYDKDKNFLARYSSSSANSFTRTVSENAHYIRCTLYASSSTTINAEYLAGLDLQLEQGTVATPYEPYTESVATLSEPITLNGFNGVQDYVDLKRGGEHYKIGKYTVTSSDSFGSFNNYVCINLDNVKYYGMSGVAVLDVLASSNYFRGASWGNPQEESVFPYWGISRIAFKTAMTLAEFKTFVAEKEAEGNPLEIYYVLAEPIETPLPDADVEVLKSLKTYDGVTHILTDSEVSPDWLLEYNTTRVGTELDEIDAELAKINKRITDIGTTAQMNYSTEEQVVGTWIDGRPIYQKTYDITGITLTANIWFHYAIEIPNLDSVLKIEGTRVSADKKHVYSMNSIVSDIAQGMKLIYNGFDNAISFIGTSDNLNADTHYFVTIQYTKTTDTV